MQRKIHTAFLIVATGAAGILVGAYAASMNRPAATADALPGATLTDSSAALAEIRQQLLPAGTDGDIAQLSAMVEALAAVMDAEVAERRYLAEEIESLRRDVSGILEKFSASRPNQSMQSRRAQAATDTATRLLNAGLAEDDVEFIRRRLDEYEMAMLNLRDTASREGWANSPRFSEEVQKIRQRREALRDELDESTYDNFLYAMGRPNRVVVSGVLLTSPAAEIGLQNGDQLLRYGNSRLYNSNDLRSATQGGTRGAPVSLQVLRNGQVVELYVPAGPLGVRLQTRRENPVGN